MRVTLLLAVMVILLGGSVALAQDRPLQVRGVTLANAGYRGGGGGGYGSDECREQLDELAKLGCNWIAVTEHVYMEDVRQPELRWREGRGERLVQTVADARERGIKVLFKPHIWSRQFGRGGEWHGTVAMTNEADWAAFFKNYGDFLVEHARIAQQAGADAFCIGTELKSTSGREADWRRLIARVREVYDGALTYSAAGDEWKTITWWGAVDCVGITAYYAVANEDNASEDAIRAGWREIYAELIPFAQRVNRPICFTELGYSVSAHAARAPWEYDVVEPNPELQARLFRVAIEEARRSGVVDGILLWKWFTLNAEEAARRERHDAFGLQWRPLALAVIREQWADPVEEATDDDE